MSVDWQFHFRSFNEDKGQTVRVHRGGGRCGGTPWSEGRPKCWDSTIHYGPAGEDDKDVYVPSNWTASSADWIDIAVDGLQLLLEFGITCPESPSNDKLAEIIADVLGIGFDVVSNHLMNNVGQAILDKMSDLGPASILTICQKNGFSYTRICDIAEEMKLGDTWGLMAGSAYNKYIHGDGDPDTHVPTIGDHGWSVCRGGHNDFKKKTATACFMHNGHLIYAVGDAHGDGDNISDFWEDEP